MKQVRYFLEAIAVYILFALFRTLPTELASDMGGWLARTIGPKLAASRKALTNLRAALPARTDADHRSILAGMWDNLGRTFAEYPHLQKIAAKRTEIIGAEILTALPPGSPFILFSAHMGNWEVGSTSFYTQLDIATHPVYRAPNNPWIRSLLNRCRSLNNALSPIPKSRSGARRMIEALQNGEALGILIDQKYNTGLAVPFFGREAMTSPAFVQMAQKFQCPLIPVRGERLPGARFRITVFPPLEIKERRLEEAIAQAHTLLEEWISERPEQWLWLHRRWG